MGTRHEMKGRVIVVKPYRKAGNGAKGGGRTGVSGKRGFVYVINPENKERTLVAQAEGATFSDMCRHLRSATQIPMHVTIQKKGETYF
jgi:hypothetical protein